jgi:hypothetical protein
MNSLRARKSQLPRIGALPMLDNARQCQPVGRPLQGPDGYRATGPDPLGLTAPEGWSPNAMQVEGQPPPEEWNCSICLCKLDGPAEEEEATTIAFEAIVERSYVQYVDDPNAIALIGTLESVLGYDEQRYSWLVSTSSDYAGTDKTWVRVEVKVQRNGRQLMERIAALARSRPQTLAFFQRYEAAIDPLSIFDANESRYVVQQLEVCGHQCHRKCLKRMFSAPSVNRFECPLCKQEVLSEEVEYLRSDFDTYEVTGMGMQRNVDRLLSAKTAMVTDPGYLGGNPRYLSIHAHLTRSLNAAIAALDAFRPQIARAFQKKPGELDASGQRVATWQQMAAVLNPQGGGLPPRQKFPLALEEERDVVRFIHEQFEAAVDACAVRFPVRASGIYPDTTPAQGPFYIALMNILDDNMLMARVLSYVQRRHTDVNTPLTPGNEAIFLNTWKSLKRKAVKTGTNGGNDRVSERRLLRKTYERMLTEPNLTISGMSCGDAWPRDMPDFDRIARAGQAEVLGTRFFYNYADLRREQWEVKKVHDENVVLFSQSLKKDYRIIDIALRTHPLLDCNTGLLKQTVRFLNARNHADFRRHYKTHKYYCEYGIWLVVQEVVQSLGAPTPDRLCSVYSRQSILDTLLVNSQNSIEDTDKGISGWLELIKPDVVKIYNAAPWRQHWNVDDLFNAITSAYMLTDVERLDQDVTRQMLVAILEYARVDALYDPQIQR